MIILTADEVITLHQRLILKTGGLDGIREVGLLESAVWNCFQTFDEEELYPGVIEKSARMAFGICQNHPFIDGNKRTAVLAMLTILRVNQISLRYTQEELITLGLSVADGTMNYEAIVSWIHEHLE